MDQSPNLGREMNVFICITVILGAAMLSSATPIEYNGGSPGSGQNLETEGNSNGGPHTGVLYKKSVSEQSYHKRDAEIASEKHNQPSYNKHPTGDHHDARGHVDEGHHGPKQNPEGHDHQGSRRYTSAELKDGRRHEHHPDHHRSGEETGSHQRSSHEHSSEKDIHHNHPDGKRYDKADHGSHEGAEEKTYASRESQGGHSGKHRVGKGEDGGQRRYELGAEKGAQSHEGHDENTHTSNEGSSGESHGAARRNGKGTTERYGSEEGSGRETTAMVNPSQIDTHLHDIPRDRHSRRQERDGNVHHHAGASPDHGRDHPLTVLPSPVDLPEYHEPATQHGKHHKRGHHHGQGRHKAFRGPRGRHGTYHPTGHVRTARVTHHVFRCPAVHQQVYSVHVDPSSCRRFYLCVQYQAGRGVPVTLRLHYQCPVHTQYDPTTARCTRTTVCHQTGHKHHAP